MAVPPHYNQWAPPLPQADGAHDEVLVNDPSSSVCLFVCFGLMNCSQE